MAQHHLHPLRWSRLSDQYRPAAAAWLQWLNDQLQAGPQPDPQLLALRPPAALPADPQLVTVLRLAAVTKHDTGAAVRKVLGTAPPADGAAIHQAMARELNAAGHRRPTPAQRTLRRQQREQQQQAARR